MNADRRKINTVYLIKVLADPQLSSEVDLLQLHRLTITAEDGVLEHLHDFISSAVEVGQQLILAHTILLSVVCVIL
jgi:hypothetical protein